MVFQFVQDSPWKSIFVGVSLLMCAVAFAVLIFARMSLKRVLWTAISLYALAAAFGVGAFVLDSQQTAENNARFSQQLMDEYDVTSGRDLSALRQDFERFDEARTVFIRDGKETPVFVKLVHRDDQKIDMAFTVIDDKDLFPKPSK